MCMFEDLKKISKFLTPEAFAALSSLVHQRYLFAPLPYLSDESAKKVKSKLAYINLRLYLLCNYLLDTTEIQGSARELLEKFKNRSVIDLVKFFNCTKQTLSDYLLRSIGSRMNSQCRYEDKVAKGLIYLEYHREYFEALVDSSGKISFRKPLNSSYQVTDIDKKEINEREFVFSLDGRLYIHDRARMKHFFKAEEYRVKHSSFLGGGAVLCAGMMKVVNGVITEISNESGHYSPTYRETAIFLLHLRDRGVDLSKITLKMSYPELSIKADRFLVQSDVLKTLTKLDRKEENIKKEKEFKDEVLFQIEDLKQYPTPELDEFFIKIQSEYQKLAASRVGQEKVENEGLSGDALISANTKRTENYSRKITQQLIELWANEFKDDYYSISARTAFVEIAKYADKELSRELLEKNR